MYGRTVGWLPRNHDVSISLSWRRVDEIGRPRTEYKLAKSWGYFRGYLRLAEFT
jgi:hypothetical protein